MRTVRAIRYLTPLREGGSVPAIVEADDDGTYVAKFRGAAQGPRALVAELIAGELALAQGGRINQTVSACEGECVPQESVHCTQGIVCATGPH